jgi:hypothetical protein
MAQTGTPGTGSTNYITKWTSTATLGNSQIFDNGTNVGIGTTSPGAKLDVNGDVNVSGTLTTGPNNIKPPIAYARIAYDGTKESGSANITCAYDDTGFIYTVSVAGEPLDDCIPIVTPFAGRVGSWDLDFIDGNIRLQFSLITDSPDHVENTITGFSIVIYKP